MSFIADYHTHSKYSFDGEMGIETLAQKAIENNICEIAITDHYDLALQKEKMAPFDCALRAGDIKNARKKSEGKLNILSGIELGQPAEASEIANSILDSNDFDIVLGSLHWIPNHPDFYLIEYNTFSDEYLIRLWRKYLDELAVHIEWGKGKFNVMTHILYPLRYYFFNGRHNLINVEKYRDDFADIFSMMKKNDIALEINTSKFEIKEIMTPNIYIIKLYIELGGKLITVASDAHRPETVGYMAEHFYNCLKEWGIHEIARVKNRKIYTEKF